MLQPKEHLEARAALRRRTPSTRRYNGSGVERRATAAARRSRTLPLNASARTTGYTYRSQLRRDPLADPHAMAATATTTEGYTKVPQPQPLKEARSQQR